jgi:hypothetical protein
MMQIIPRTDPSSQIAHAQLPQQRRPDPEEDRRIEEEKRERDRGRVEERQRRPDPQEDRRIEQEKLERDKRRGVVNPD